MSDLPENGALTDAPTTGLRIPGFGNVPRPLLEAAEKEAKALLNGDAAGAATITGALGFFGVTAATQSYLLGLIGLGLGAITYGTTLYAQAQAAYRVWRDAERDVTPTAKPSAADGTPLVKLSEVTR